MKKAIGFILSFFILCSGLTVNSNAVSAKAYILVNADTLGVITGENYNIKLPMASTTKIMTALILAEQNTPNRKIKVTSEMVDVEGSSMGLCAGDEVSFKDLMYGLLLTSGNDAANVVAYVLGGSLDGFAKLMNKKARSLGLKNTNFVTPSGLDDENHYTTAYDLAVLTAYALKNQTFKKAVSCYKAIVNFGSPPVRKTITNHNKLLVDYEYAIGVKTGFTKKSGRCLVSAAERDGKTVICVTLNDPDDWKDHRKLLDLGLNSLTVVTPSDRAEITDAAVFCGEKDKVGLDLNFGAISISESEAEKLNYKINYQKILIAPVHKGQIIGTIDYYIDNKKVKSFNITAKDNVNVLKNEPFDIFLCCFKLLLN